MNGGDPWVRMDGWPVELQLSSEKRFARVLRQLCVLFLGEHVVLDMRFFKYGFYSYRGDRLNLGFFCDEAFPKTIAFDTSIYGVTTI